MTTRGHRLLWAGICVGAVWGAGVTYFGGDYGALAAGVLAIFGLSISLMRPQQP